MQSFTNGSTHDQEKRKKSPNIKDVLTELIKEGNQDARKQNRNSHLINTMIEKDDDGTNKVTAGTTWLSSSMRYNSGGTSFTHTMPLPTRMITSAYKKVTIDLYDDS